MSRLMFHRHSLYTASRPVTIGLMVVVLSLGMMAGRAVAQDVPVSVSAGIDVTPNYMFRGIRQNSSNRSDVAWWPYIDLGIAAFEGDGGLKSLDINAGTWNSMHSDQSGVYETDIYASLGFGFGGGVALGTTYTSYTSPNDSFTHVKELALSLSVDDGEYLGDGALNPYVLFAFEMGAEEGANQADGGLKAGRYLELGIAPGYSGANASLSVPIKVGLSAGNYYELDGIDNTFGFFSVAGAVSAPVGSNWDVHGGVEFQALGDTTKALNNGDGSQVIVSGGFGLSY